MWRSVKIPSKSGLGGLDLIPCLLEAFKQGTALEVVLNKKILIQKNQDFGGLERIRTAVEAFAELCLATRPQDHRATNVVYI